MDYIRQFAAGRAKADVSRSESPISDIVEDQDAAKIVVDQAISQVLDAAKAVKAAQESVGHDRTDLSLMRMKQEALRELLDPEAGSHAQAGPSAQPLKSAELTQVVSSDRKGDQGDAGHVEDLLRAVAQAELQAGTQADKLLITQIETQVDAQVNAQIETQVEAQIETQVSAQLPSTAAQTAPSRSASEEPLSKASAQPIEQVETAPEAQFFRDAGDGHDSDPTQPAFHDTYGPPQRDTQMDDDDETPVIAVSIRDANGYSTIFRCKVTTKLSKLFRVFAVRYQTELDKLRFISHDGRLLPKNNCLTLESAGIEDGDEIDVMLEQLGGSM